MLFGIVSRAVLIEPCDSFVMKISFKFCNPCGTNIAHWLWENGATKTKKIWSLPGNKERRENKNNLFSQEEFHSKKSIESMLQKTIEIVCALICYFSLYEFQYFVRFNHLFRYSFVSMPSTAYAVQCIQVPVFTLLHSLTNKQKNNNNMQRMKMPSHPMAHKGKIGTFW